MRKLCILIFCSLTVACCKKSPQTINKTEELIVQINLLQYENEFKESYKLLLSEKYSNLSEDEWQIALSEVNDEDIIKSLAKAYSNIFSEKEIDEMLVFFKSSTGKNFINKQIQIMEEMQTNRNELFNKIELKAQELNHK